MAGPWPTINKVKENKYCCNSKYTLTFLFSIYGLIFVYGTEVNYTKLYIANTSRIIGKA